MTKVHIAYEILGWYGTFAILLAYALVSYGFLPSTGLAYQMLNLTGALGIMAISYKKKVMQTVALNIIWSLIGIIARARIFL